MKKLEKRKLEMAKKMLGMQRSISNQKYGEFILQTNEVQYKLNMLIILYSLTPDKEFCSRLPEMMMGPLITLAQSCVPFSTEYLNMLKEYVNNRNKLSHKMFSLKRLTDIECSKALSSGEKIIILLDKLIKIKST